MIESACAVMIEVMKQPSAHRTKVQFVFTVQEEIGTRGATTSAFGLDPEVAFSIDVTATGTRRKGIAWKLRSATA